MADNVYVKIGQDGQYIERIAGPREIDHINLRAMGFVLKGSKGAPKPSEGVTPEPADSDEVPTSVRAAEERLSADSTGGSKKSSS